MIVVARDTEGLRLVFEQMLERDHNILRLAPQMEGKPDAHKEQLMRSVTKVTFSPGYERWAMHLMFLERLHKLGLSLGELLATEVAGLQVLDAERNKHRSKHPTCYACGIPQDNRFQIECVSCHAKFGKRGK